jgi:hypothetical protein
LLVATRLKGCTARSHYHKSGGVPDFNSDLNAFLIKADLLSPKASEMMRAIENTAKAMPEAKASYGSEAKKSGPGL